MAGGAVCTPQACAGHAAGGLSVAMPLQTRCDHAALLCHRSAAIVRFVSSCRTITDIAKICTRWYGYARHRSILSTSSCHSTLQKDSVEKKEGAEAASSCGSEGLQKDFGFRRGCRAIFWGVSLSARFLCKAGGVQKKGCHFTPLYITEPRRFHVTYYLRHLGSCSLA